jgi:DNA-binding MarR family transcriptional regulator
MSSFSDESAANHRSVLIGQLQLLGELSSTETALFHQTAAAHLDLGITDIKTVSILLRDGPMTAGQIASRLSLTTGAVTNVIDRLEKRQFVTRAADPGDRRKVIVTANQSRLSASPNVYQSIGQAFAALHQSYSTEQLEFLVRYHQATLDVTRQEIKKLSAVDH